MPHTDYFSLTMTRGYLFIRHYIKLYRKVIVNHLIPYVGEKGFGAVLHVELGSVDDSRSYAGCPVAYHIDDGIKADFIGLVFNGEVSFDVMGIAAFFPFGNGRSRCNHKFGFGVFRHIKKVG